MVDRARQALEEPRQGSGVLGVEGRGVSRADLGGRFPEPVGVTAGEDDIGPLRPGAPGCLQPDAPAAAYYDDGLLGQFGPTLGGDSSGRGGHGTSGDW
jgi:hypothetical protein